MHEVIGDCDFGKSCDEGLEYVFKSSTSLHFSRGQLSWRRRRLFSLKHLLGPASRPQVAAGEIKSFTGMSADAPYEEPPNPEIRLPNYRMTVDESVQVLMSELRKAGVLSGGPTNPMEIGRASCRERVSEAV